LAKGEYSAATKQIRIDIAPVCHSTIRVAGPHRIGILPPMDNSIREMGERDFDRIATAIVYIADHARDQPSLEQVAAAARLSPYHFARLFRRWAGISPKQYLQRLSVDAAGQSLAGRASVLEAALDAGLSGPGRLHDLFVAIDAVTPGEFKARGAGLEFVHGMAASPFGRARIARSSRGISFLGFADKAGHVAGWSEFQQSWSRASWREDHRSAGRVARLIWGSTPGNGHGLRLWVHGSNFQVQVWQALLRLARDATVDYSGIAQQIGRPTAARAVGGAVGANPVAWLIPCHHVLRANGALGGYRWGVERKRAMLAWELSQRVAAAP
jgi:AraC family transcriptional regulator of adaptative response/methylated-DNA-[protein]-cysteine methyltransferase